MWRGIARTVLWILVIGGCLASFIGGCIEPIFFLGIPATFLVATGFGMFVELMDNVAAIKKLLKSIANQRNIEVYENEAPAMPNPLNRLKDTSSYGGGGYQYNSYPHPNAPKNASNGSSSLFSNGTKGQDAQPSTWTCRKCGNDNSNSVRFCAVCGASKR